jgi:putative CocE/NonD family hydrolase
MRALLMSAALALGCVGATRAEPAPPPEPSPPRCEVVLDEARIPIKDGVGLAADLWRPKAPGRRFPVLLEYLPYRKVEGRGERYSLYAYFARRGYVVVRVDIRGTGLSEGTLIPYEYSEIEQRDGDEVITWLARQPFSTGNVGMFGISWGGFNSIQMAMRHPPALKTILALDATDDAASAAELSTCPGPYPGLRDRRGASQRPRELPLYERQAPAEGRRALREKRFEDTIPRDHQ